MRFDTYESASARQKSPEFGVLRPFRDAGTELFRFLGLQGDIACFEMEFGMC
jgi:hypothetical protein